jgi:hypothetical protein
MIALASAAGLLVLAGCSNAPHTTAAAPAYQRYGYVAPNVAPNAMYGENYVPPYGESYEAPYAPYEEIYQGPYHLGPNAQICGLTNKHPSGAVC